MTNTPNEPTVQVDVTLRLTEKDAERLRAVLQDEDFRPNLLTFLTPWRDTQVFAVSIDSYQFGRTEE